MSYSSDAADQVLRMALKGTELAVRLAGRGAREIAAVLGSLFSDDKKTRGRTRLTNMLRSGKELRVFTVRDSDLRSFCTEARRYGVQYTVIKDRTADDGITDILVKKEDAAKVNRIFRRMDTGMISIPAERSVQGPVGNGKPEETKETSRKVLTQQEMTEAFLREVIKGDQLERTDTTEVRTEMTDPSGLFSKERQLSREEGTGSSRTSVSRELKEIRDIQKRIDPEKYGQRDYVLSGPVSARYSIIGDK